MPKLELKSYINPKAPSVDVLALNGGLDLSALGALQAHLTELQEKKRLQVVVDLSELGFISSSGLGAFLSTVNHFREGGGDLAFVGLSPKIHKVFTMVGFLRVLTVLPDLEAGLDHFGRPKPPRRPVGLALSAPRPQLHSGEPFILTATAVDEVGQPTGNYDGTVALKPGWGIVSPLRIGPFKDGTWSGPVILTGPGEILLRAKDQGLEGSLRLSIVEQKEPAQFPLQVACPGCGQAMAAPTSNVYRCRHCSEVLLVDRWGQPISLRQSAEATITPAQVYQLLLPADVNCLGYLRDFVAGLLHEQGYTEDFVNDVELALDEALTNVVEHAYEYDVSKSIALRVTLEKNRATVMLRDMGKVFDRKSLPQLDLSDHIQARKPGGLGRFLMENLMDSIDYSSGPEGNTLLMVKRVPD
jgi:anti-anti-sigma factor